MLESLEGIKIDPLAQIELLLSLEEIKKDIFNDSVRIMLNSMSIETEISLKE